MTDVVQTSTQLRTGARRAGSYVVRMTDHGSLAFDFFDEGERPPIRLDSSETPFGYWHNRLEPNQLYLVVADSSLYPRGVRIDERTIRLPTRQAQLLCDQLADVGATEIDIEAIKEFRTDHRREVVDTEMRRVTGRGTTFWTRLGFVSMALNVVLMGVIVVRYGDPDVRDVGVYVVFAALGVLILLTAFSMGVPEVLGQAVDAGRDPHLSPTVVLGSFAAIGLVPLLLVVLPRLL